MLLEQSRWAQVEKYLETSTGIIIPVGSMEQHGPNGLIATDAICPEVIARATAAKTGFLVGPTIALGAAQFNLAFPGTISMRPATLMAVVQDYVNSLAASGFTHFYFLNGHGGNVAPVKAAFQELYADRSYHPEQERPSIRCRLRSWWDLEETNAIRQKEYGAAEGMHATPSEVAITQYALPETIYKANIEAPERLDASFFKDHASDDHADARTHREDFPDGRIGSDPSLATPEVGEALVKAAVGDLTKDFESFLRE